MLCAVLRVVLIAVCCTALLGCSPRCRRLAPALSLRLCSLFSQRANMYDGEMIQPSFLEVGETLDSQMMLEQELDAEADFEADKLLDAIDEDSAMLEADADSETEISGTVDATSETETEAHVEVAADEAALALGTADVQSEAEVQAMTAIDAQAELEEAQELAAEAELDSEDVTALVEEEPAAEGAAGSPTYVLPYAPALPGHYSPLFNPYTNVNPLSTPFANYAAQPGAHPGVAAAAAAQAGALAAVNGQIAGSPGGYPYYPYAARDAIVAQNLIGNAVPFSGYAGWVHPQNLNSASVGENAPEEFPQFVEVVSAAEAEESDCQGCQFA